MAAHNASMVLAGLLLVLPAVGRAETEASLRCRLDHGPWQPCRMVVDHNGMSWQLMIGSERIRFRHDGRGSITMRKGPQPWQAVDARWLADAGLCWDGVCAQGAIPLD